MSAEASDLEELQNAALVELQELLTNDYYTIAIKRVGPMLFELRAHGDRFESFRIRAMRTGWTMVQRPLLVVGADALYCVCQVSPSIESDEESV